MPLTGSSKVTKAPATDGHPDAESATTICGRKGASCGFPTRGMATDRITTTPMTNGCTEILADLMTNLDGTVLRQL
jgi:hypothetical protein